MMRIIFVLALAVLMGTAAQAAPEQVERGEYLARIGNCAGCHTAPGGEPYAGGRPLASPFGTFYAPNITPDPSTGIGRWSAEQFWGALHEGERPDGTALYPACPYPSYTRVRREDVAAIHAYLRTIPPVQREDRPHVLSWPASSRALVAAWQWLYFEPAAWQPDPQRSQQWNRGAYLVEGLGHCSACHAERNFLGATRSDPAAPGSTVHGWYAPSLHDSTEAGLQGYEPARAAALLRRGKAGDAATMGPMADVVFESLQYLSPADAAAMAAYLRSLPDQAPASPQPKRLSPARRAAAGELGRAVYEEHCQDCHGEDGEGSETAPALAGNRTVTMDDQTNLRTIIRLGGYPPSTHGNPRPYGMPPFHHLNAEQLRALITYLRTSWGNAEPTGLGTAR